MKKSPVLVVKERFQSKDKLVEAVQKLATEDLWLDRVNGAKGLARVTNKKLVRLHDTLTDAKARFGSRAKLISAILELNKRVKDQGYEKLLGSYPLPRLLDLHASAARAAKKAPAVSAKPKPAKADKPVKATAPKAAAPKASAEKAAKPAGDAKPKKAAAPKKAKA
ncbi:MAG TPA: hypothetical protein VGM29_17520 [Polyangiaceae bacterium]|jgi:hypothetical protein